MPRACWITPGEVIINLFLVCGVSAFDALLQVVSDSTVQFSVTRSEGSVAVLQKGLDLLFLPWFPFL